MNVVVADWLRNAGGKGSSCVLLNDSLVIWSGSHHQSACVCYTLGAVYTKAKTESNRKRAKVFLLNHFVCLFFFSTLPLTER